MSLLGLDIGTTGCKAVVFDYDGRILGQAYREYPLLHPRNDWAELDANRIWNLTEEVLKTAIASAKNDPVKALSISVQGEAVVPVKKDGQVLCNFVVTFDKRTQPQYEWWNQTLGKQRIFEISGMPLHPMYSVNKIMWFKENMPELFGKAWKFLCVEDFIIYRLTGETVIDYSLAARTMAFDVRKKVWSEEILGKADIDSRVLSSVVPSGYVVGKVMQPVADELGMTGDVFVVTGGHDQPCGALGAGIIGAGMAMNAIGTSDCVCPAFEKPILTSSMLEGNYSCYPHVVGDMYVTIAFNLTGGLLLRWYRDTLCQYEMEEAAKTGKDVYDIIVERASPVPFFHILLAVERLQWTLRREVR
jgi:xylulokinase